MQPDQKLQCLARLVNATFCYITTDSKGPDQTVRMIKLIWGYNVCISQGTCSSYESYIAYIGFLNSKLYLALLYAQQLHSVTDTIQ